MIFYLGVLLVTTFFAFLANATARKPAKGLVSNDIYTELRPNFFFATIVVLIFVIIAGIRSSWNDTGLYIFSFENHVSSDFNSYLQNDFKPFKGDWAFEFVLTFIKSFISTDYTAFIMFFSAVTIICNIVMLGEYSRDYTLAIFLFVATEFYWTQMGAIRQSFAAALIFAAFPLIQNGKWLQFFAVVFVAAQFHNSAYMFILLYFVCKIPAFSKYSLFILLAAALLFISYPLTGGFLNELLGESKYGVSYGAEITTGNDGSSPLRIVIELVPIVLSLIVKDEILKREKHANTVFNLTIVQVVCSVFSVRYWIFYRITVYTQVFSIILLCWSLKYLKNNSNFKPVIKTSCYLLYFIYYYVFMKLSASTYVSEALNIVASHK